MKRAKVIGSSRDEYGNLVGTNNNNPILNKNVYDVEFPYGMVQKLYANIISENILSHVDNYGFQHELVEAIIDYQRDDNALRKCNEFVTTNTGRRRLRKETKGWKLLIVWKS